MIDARDVSIPLIFILGTAVWLKSPLTSHLVLGDVSRRSIPQKKSSFFISGSGVIHHGDLERDVGVDKSDHGEKVELPKLDIGSHQTIFISPQRDAPPRVLIAGLLVKYFSQY